MYDRNKYHISHDKHSPWSLSFALNIATNIKYLSSLCCESDTLIFVERVRQGEVCGNRGDDAIHSAHPFPC